MPDGRVGSEMDMLRQPGEEVVDKVVAQMDEPLEHVVGKLETWAETLTGMIPNFVVAILVMCLFWGLSVFLAWSAKRVFARVSANQALNNLVGTVVRWLTLTAGMFIALGLLQLDKTLTSLLAGAGVIGLALGFAFQNVAANLLSGVLLSVRKPFGVGDVIRSNEFYGTVMDINLRTTDLRTPDGRFVLIPNKEVFENVIENYTWDGKRRVELVVGISYGDDLERAQRLTKEAVEAIEERDTARQVEVLYQEFGSSSINFQVRFWIDFRAPVDELRATSRAVIAIKQAFDDNDITIPFPIRTLDFGIKGGATLSEMALNLDSRRGSGGSGGEGGEES